MRRGNEHVYPAAGASLAAGPGPRAWPPGVTYSGETTCFYHHVKGNEGTCGLVLPFPCFLPGCCDSL